MDNATLTWVVSARDLAAQEGSLLHGGVFVPAPDPLPAPFATIVLRVEVPGVDVAVVATSVVQVSAQGVGLTFQDRAAGRQAILGLIARAPTAAVDAGQASETMWEAITAPAPDAAEARGAPAEADAATSSAGPDAEDEGGRATPDADAAAQKTAYDRIKALTAAEKLQLARTGDRAERLLLLKEPNKTIHFILLQNPKITLDEIRYMAGYRQTNPDALKAIAQSREWTRNPAIVSALVANPKTPPAVAVALLDRISPDEIQRLAKSPSSPPAVAAAAKRRVASR